MTLTLGRISFLTLRLSLLILLLFMMSALLRLLYIPDRLASLLAAAIVTILNIVTSIAWQKRAAQINKINVIGGTITKLKLAGITFKVLSSAPSLTRWRHILIALITLIWGLMMLGLMSLLSGPDHFYLKAFATALIML